MAICAITSPPCALIAGGRIVAVIVAEGEVREDHRDLLAEIRRRSTAPSTWIWLFTSVMPGWKT
jgi:hypothetical protein